MNPEKNISTQDNFDIMHVLSQFTSRWYWFLIAIPIFLSLAVWKNKQAVPQYHISSKILIEVAKDRVIYDEGAGSAVNLMARSKTVNNEIQVLHSRDLVERSLDSLGLNTTYFYESQPKIELYGEELPFDIRADFKSAGRLGGAQFKLQMKDDKQFDLSVDNAPIGTFSMGQMIKCKDFVFIIDRNPESELELASLEPVILYMDTPEALVNKYMSRLVVQESDKDTDAIMLALDDNVAKRGEAFLNTLLECYFMKLLEDRQKAAETTYKFIDDRLSLNFGHLDSLEFAIESFKRNNDIVDPEIESRYILQGIKQFEVELSDAETQLEIVSGLVDRSLSNPRQEMDFSVPNTTLGVTDPLLNDLVKELNRKQNKLRTLSKTVQPDNPLYQELAAEIDDLRGSMMLDLLNLKENMETTVRHINNRIGEYKYRLDAMSFDEKGLTAMERVRANKEELYVYLLKKREEAAMVLASELMDTWVIERPFSSAPFYNPKRGVVLIIGLFLGLFFPVSIILLWMMFDGKVRRLADVKLGGRTPNVGHVSLNSAANGAMGNSPLTHLALLEDLKQLAFNLRFQFPKMKRLMVTSAGSGEGKTFLSYHLALSEVALGKRVCLLELDLRRPVLAAKIQKPEAKGLVEYLIGDTVAKAIQHKLPFAEGLTIIPAGQCPIDPSRLLISDKLDQLMTQLSKDFDLIIIDTPGLTQVSDALQLSRFSDAVALVVRQGKTKVEQLKALKGLIANEQLTKSTLVYNGVREKRTIPTQSAQGASSWIGRLVASLPLVGTKKATTWRA